MFHTPEERDKLKEQHYESFVDWRDNPKKFAIIPDGVIFSDKLTDGEKLFYCKLTALSNKTSGDLRHSNETLAKELNCGISNVKKYLDALKKKGLIQTLSTGPHNMRFICLTPWNYSN